MALEEPEHPHLSPCPRQRVFAQEKAADELGIVCTASPATGHGYNLFGAFP